MSEEEYTLPPEFEELKGSAEELSEEEKEKRREELKEMDQSDLLEEYELD